ncbi:unnamed protein product, partial [Sphenostylis stenocarpa]
MIHRSFLQGSLLPFEGIFVRPFTKQGNLGECVDYFALKPIFVHTAVKVSMLPLLGIIIHNSHDLGASKTSTFLPNYNSFQA